MPNRSCKKVFGVALDASDDPMSLQLKWAAMQANQALRNNSFTDPYDAAAARLAQRGDFELAGKLPVPSWLGSRPMPADQVQVTLENYQRFYDTQGFRKLSDQVNAFVRDKILPDIPVMLGIDHSATGGVVTALSEKYGAGNITVIVLDRHFDGIDLAQRVDALLSGPDQPAEMMPFSGTGGKEYCCGSFWGHLLDSGTLPAHNLLFLGVADYPAEPMQGKQQLFQDTYLAFEQSGCRFFPLWEFTNDYIEKLTGFIKQHVTTPYVYVSLDVDVGSLNCVHAARYMDGPGISRENMLDIARVINHRIEEAQQTLIGLDIMEFNMHFLGISIDDDCRDQTLEMILEFINTLIPDTTH
jgi:arginase family enzyme